MYEKIKEELNKEANEKYKNSVALLDKENEYNKTQEERLKYVVRHVLNKTTSYAGSYEDQRKKVMIALERKRNKELQKRISEVEFISNAKPLPNDLIITIEWKRSQMWGYNPNAFDNYGNESGSIGGCGYDKLSTATSRILNQHTIFLKLMLDKKEDFLKNNVLVDNNATHREILGYGSGYGIIPKFEGGVGVSCHEIILKNLGFRMRHITSTKQTDVFLISWGVEE